jgi:signal transduction histidine kinase
MLGLLVRALLGTPWFEALVFAMPMALLAAPISLSAWYLCRAMPLSRVDPARVATSSLLAAIITSSFWAGLGRGWWVALDRLGLEMGETTTGPLVILLVGLGAVAYLLSVTVHYLFQAFEESAAAARRALESQVSQRDAELRALRAQVDPHFLFNSLNSISGLITADPERARMMCLMLGDLLRDSLTLGGAERIGLGREVALATQYLRIEQVRFGRRLEVDVDVAPDAETLRVPPLIVQPLVENAVRHGIATCVGGGTVAVTARRAGSRAVIVVTNPRDPDHGRSGTGFGLDIVRRRLERSYGPDAALAVEPAEASYRVTVTLPAEEERS